MNKGNLKEDPRGLLFEAYRMDGITSPECKTIFLVRMREWQRC